MMFYLCTGINGLSSDASDENSNSLIVDGSDSKNNDDLDDGVVPPLIERSNNNDSIENDISIAGDGSENHGSGDENVRTIDAIATDTVGQRNDHDEKQIEGRRIIELNHFMDQLSLISEHDPECHFSDLIIGKEIRNGLSSQLLFRCRNCDKHFQSTTNSTDPMCINSTTVLATNMIGIGYYQLEQFASVIDVPVMCADKYKKLNDKIGEYWQETAEESMREAAEEERKAAIDRGDVDPEDGIPYITVVVDEAWGKRSYNKNYTSLSGVAAIVGAHTGKVLWIGVRNKYCVTCVRAENKDLTPPPHVCTKNFTGASSEMEWQSILEGFQRSVELHNLRYLKVIADGDSSTYNKLLEHKPYGDRYIQKYECRNHLRRNFRKQLESAAEGCPRGLRTHVIRSFERIRKDINSAIEYRTKENTTEEQKVALLKFDINNVVHHVFGDHSNCPSYIKKYCKEDDKNYIPDLTNSGTYEKICQATRRLMYCSSDLILGYTNNNAEHYNSIVAKFVGGKRVNFSLSNSYKHKANAAAVQYNKKSAIKALYRTKFNTDPPYLATKIQLKRLRKCERDKERRQLRKANKVRPKKFCRRKQTPGTGYGVRADLKPVDFENEKKIFLEKLEKYQEKRLSIEKDTTHDKYKCSLWEEVSRKVLMASNFGLICKARVFAGHVKTITQDSFGINRAMKHALESVSVALVQLGKEQAIQSVPCGLLVDKDHSCLAASSSGIVLDSDTIIHIECPISIFNKDSGDQSVLGKMLFAFFFNKLPLRFIKSTSCCVIC